MLRALRELIRGMKIGLQEFHRSSEEIQQEMRNAIEVRPMDKTDRRLVRNVILFLALICYTFLCLSLFGAL
jgi:hypothetical protein